MLKFTEQALWPGTRLVIAAVPLMLLFSPPAFLSAAQATGTEAQDGAPVVISRARQYDIKSKLNGLTYRVMITGPLNPDPAIAYPVIYLLDGNATFPKASPALTRPTPGNAILVGIGYPTDEQPEFRRRRFMDLTPSVSKTPDPDGLKTGGGDAFFRVIEEELKPFVMARYHVDRTKQTIYGHSLGGLFVLRALFRNPNAYSAYIIASPSIWYNDREVLKDEEAFSKRARGGTLRLKVLVTSAGDEQYRGEDPKRLAAANASRMVDNASELADRLALLDPKNVPVTRVIFPSETHDSVQGAAISRALRFALPPE